MVWIEVVTIIVNNSNVTVRYGTNQNNGHIGDSQFVHCTEVVLL